MSFAPRQAHNALISVELMAVSMYSETYWVFWFSKNFKFLAKNHLVKVGTLNLSVKCTAYIHKGTQSSAIYVL